MLCAPNDLAGEVYELDNCTGEGQCRQWIHRQVIRVLDKKIQWLCDLGAHGRSM